MAMPRKEKRCKGIASRREDWLSNGIALRRGARRGKGIAARRAAVMSTARQWQRYSSELQSVDSTESFYKRSVTL